MKTNPGKIAAGLAAVALLAAGPITAADARGGGGGGGGVKVQPRPLPPLPQLPQLPQQPQLPQLPQLPQQELFQVKVLRLGSSCRAGLPLARSELEYEVSNLGTTMLVLEVDNGPRNTPVTFRVDGADVATATTDAFGTARWTGLNNPLVPTVTSTMQVIDSNGVVAGTSC